MLGLEPLETRALLSVSSSLGFAGLAFPDSGFSVPPDTHAAVGPNHIVEVVNTTVAFFDKATGSRLFQQPLDSFFGVDLSSCAQSDIFDPKSSYDELAARFVVLILQQNPCVRSSHLLIAFSDDSDPNGAWEKHALDVTDASLDGTPLNTWGDFPGLGWDQDAIYVTLNMYTWLDVYDHVSVVTIDQVSAFDGDPATFSRFQVDRDGSHITMQPAAMHGAAAGAPMYFVEEAGFANGLAIRVVQMTGKLSATPQFTDRDIPVDRYTFPPNAKQRGTRQKIDTNDNSILNAEWRNDRLVASQTVGLPGRKESHARWYEFSTQSFTLTQQGTVHRGSGVHTYYPSIAIAGNGDLGLTFMQSSRREFISMYVTGQLAGAAPGVMETPLRAKAGEAAYRSGRPPHRAGDYSSVVVDPASGTSFWAANEYATPDRRNNWGTWIAHFSLTAGIQASSQSIIADVTGNRAVSSTNRWPRLR